MNKYQNQFSISKLNSVFCFVMGLAILMVCQQSHGQAIATPTPRAIALQAEMVKLEKTRDEFQASVKNALEKLAQFEKDHDALKKAGSKLGISEESYPEILKTLHSQRVQLSIDLAGIDARYAAIETAIRKMSEEDEAALEPFKRMIELRQKKIDHAKAALASGTMSASELQDAEIKLLQAKMQLTQASKPSSSLAHLNSQLLDSSLERAEKTARLEKAKSLFDEVDVYLDHSKKVAALKNKIKISSRLKSKNSTNVSEVESRIAEIKRQLAELE